jgi:hypothetical protein
MPTYKGNRKSSSNEEVPPVSILKPSSLSKRKSSLTGEGDTATATAESPIDQGSKVSRPQGTSPMARDSDKDDDLDVGSLTMDIDNTGDSLDGEDDQDSIARAISSTRKELFTTAS